MTDAVSSYTTAEEPVPDGRPPSSVSCACGFAATGWDEGVLERMHDDHVCPNEPDTPPVHCSWHRSVFSVWGVLLGSIVASVLISIFGVR